MCLPTVRISSRLGLAAAALLVLAGLPRLARAQPQEPIDWIDGPFAYEDMQLTPDGRFIAWTTINPPAGALSYIMLHDRRGDLTTWLRMPMRTTDAVGGGVRAISGDGSTVLVLTEDALLFDGDPLRCTAPAEDCNFATDLYLVPTAGGAVTRVSVDPGGNEVDRNRISGAVMSDDATRIAMLGRGLVPPDTNPRADIFVRDLRARPPTTIRLTLGISGEDPDGEIHEQMVMSGDGRFVGFVSDASNLVPGDTNGTWDVFVVEIDSGRIERVSVRSDGTEASGPSGSTAGYFSLGPEVSLSYDGQVVAFTSFADDFDPLDVATGPDIHIHDRRTGETRLATTQSGCAARDGGFSTLPSLSWNGELLAFVTRDPCFSPEFTERHGIVLDLVTRAAVAVTVPTDGTMADGPADRVLLAGLGERVLFTSEAQNLTPRGPREDRPGHYAFSTTPFRDSDGDGLYDDWEDFGLDIGGDGVIDLPLPTLGARSDHKDLFVEVDWLFAADHTHLPGDAALSQVIEAFRAAPVSNPDGNTGVRIHFAYSDPIAESASSMTLAGLTGVRAVRSDNDGDAADRGGDSARLAARHLVYRYLLVGHSRLGTTSSGVSEYPGDEFLVSLGAFDDQVGTVDQQAGTIIHELGHALGLGHGGIDDENCKPNYLSVMSYAFQFPELVPDRPLDYGRGLASLDESRLDETSGIGGPLGRSTVYGVPMPGGGRFTVVVPASGPIDWNDDGDATDLDAAADVNDLGFSGCDASPATEPLEAVDDWSRIVYDLRRTGGYGNGAGARESPDEITWEILQEIRAHRAGPANLPPIASVGPAMTVDEGAVVTLDGSGSLDPEGATLGWRWAQALGPTGAFSATDVPMPMFTAPLVDGDVTVVVELSVTDGVLHGVARYQELRVRDLGGPPADGGPDDGGSSGSDASLDAGPATPGGSSGCGCRAGAGAQGDVRWLTLSATVCLLRRRRRAPRLGCAPAR